MKESKLVVWLIGVVCGIELLVAMTIGGAGLWAFLGLEGGIVLASAGLAVAYATRRFVKIHAR